MLYCIDGMVSVYTWSSKTQFAYTLTGLEHYTPSCQPAMSHHGLLTDLIRAAG